MPSTIHATRGPRPKPHIVGDPNPESGTGIRRSPVSLQVNDLALATGIDGACLETTNLSWNSELAGMACLPAVQIGPSCRLLRPQQSPCFHAPTSVNHASWRFAALPSQPKQPQALSNQSVFKLLPCSSFKREGSGCLSQFCPMTHPS